VVTVQDRLVNAVSAGKLCTDEHIRNSSNSYCTVVAALPSAAPQAAFMALPEPFGFACDVVLFAIVVNSLRTAVSTTVASGCEVRLVLIALVWIGLLLPWSSP